MTGIAGYFGAHEGVLEQLSEALAVRGDDADHWYDIPIGLVIRAGIPQVHHGVGETRVVVDGVGEAYWLSSQFAETGPAALVGGARPYALALAQPRQRRLLLARNGDGPSLYYGQHDGGTWFASEPMMLITAGFPAGPDPAAIRRFVEEGTCDDTEATLFAGIRQVLPGQVVEVTDEGIRVTSFVGPAVGQPRVRQALTDAVGGGRVAVRLGQGLAGSALLGAALAIADSKSSLSVTSATFPALATGEDEYAATILNGLPEGAIRHKALPAGGRDIDADLDMYLRDLGEPTPDLAGYLVWSTARQLAGEVDIVVDAAGIERVLGDADGTPDENALQALGATSYFPRLADRLQARFGLTVRLPFRQIADDPATVRAQLRELVAATLPESAVRAADVVRPAAPVRELIRQLAPEFYQVFTSAGFARREWVDARTELLGLDDLVKGVRADANRFWRLYLVERWLEAVARRCRPADRTALRGPQPPAVAAPQIAVAGAPWRRTPVRTELWEVGAGFEDQIAQQVSSTVAALRAERPGGLDSPWYVVVAGHAVASAQGQRRRLWEVTPSPWARRIAARLAPEPHGPWLVQLAIDQLGSGRVLTAAAAARPGARRDLFWRLLGPAVRGLRGPGTGYPSAISVGYGPEDPARVARRVVESLSRVLPVDAARTLAGCAIVSGASPKAADSADGLGVTPGSRPSPVGRAARSAPASVLGVFADRPAEFFAALVADDPLASPEALTPIAVATLAR